MVDMSNRRKLKGPHSAPDPDSAVDSTRTSRPRLPTLPPTAANTVHVATVSLYGAEPPVWRRLEIPSAMRLADVHRILQLVFGWTNTHLHAFETPYGDFGLPSEPGLWSPGRDNDSAVALAQVAGEGAKITYVYDFGDNWQHEIIVEEILPATPGVAYPRCTGGQGNDTPQEDSGGIWTFNEERAEAAAHADDFNPKSLTNVLAHFAKVIVPGS
jgi:hypothetical protein